MTKKELIARLVEEGIDHNPKATKAELEATLVAAHNEAEDKPKRSKAEQLALYKERYEPYATENGVSMDNGDSVAKALRGAAPEVVIRAAEILKDLPKGELETRYADRNPGAKRMNSGNIIRGCVRRGDCTEKDVIATLKKANAEIHTAS